MNGKLYSTLPNTIIGFHGCDISTFNEVIMNQSELKASTNKYDWLGSGIYFWEHNLKRAYQWAKDAAKRPNSKIKTPAVIGAVIESLHVQRDEEGEKAFDSVRGLFTEGKEIYPGSGLKGKTHVQICVRNPNCIKGYFAPKLPDLSWTIP